MKNFKLGLIALSVAAAAPGAYAFQQGDFIVRAGLTNVSPDDSSSNIFVGSDLGVNLSVGDDTQLGLNVAYFVSDRLNIEVLAATPFTHDVNFGVSDPLGTGDRLGEVTHLPPTITLNYYFNNPSSAFQPYVGAGINYTVFFDEDFTSANDAAGLKNLSLDNSFGLSAQLGVDYMVNDQWFINGSVRWIDIDTEASFNLNGTPGNVNSIEIDPMVYTISLGYRF
ncbi:MAG TPA: outer membrane protein OmpW [Halieaceae bacterium]|jgi:outer membrane protein|uniref:OmpW/AlkL family protein n=1 Tax=Haliea TaxID=475794 RepID=UPI000C4E8CD1|nr:OmpW family outer membrane protein [Haliea sp.]HBM84588.1 outer membrane protein OmpW [Halieaceae bacterium]MAD65410.1 outer membrane protein OmpW [Haliea sp.]MAY91293.1 outer membrane protein OmpW [Haliea sp.]MBK40782.1 outer membrane protein OmpW [Haliea sp.]MBP69178.1 outer membrane protein OmpW [Haliea sp.]|tara:strand:+ start:12368 stop:13039 length:672 start_codon:yes stop_codon:yes gene_type:complete